MKQRLYAKDDPYKLGPFVEVERPKSLLSDSPAVRLEQLWDLYAPKDEDGVRHPEYGVISKDDFMKLLELPADPT